MSRSDARSRALRRRPSRTVPASIVAVVLLAVGVLTAIAAIARLAGGTWASQVTTPLGTVGSQTWGSPYVIGAGVVVVLLGIVLLVAGIKPGAFTTAQLASGSSEAAVDETDYVISTRALARLAAATAESVDGVDKVSASASGRRVLVSVTTTSEQGSQIQDRVRQSVVDVLTAAGVSPAPRVTATVRTKEI